VAGVGPPDAARVIGFTQDPADKSRSILYGVDVESGEVGFRKTIPFPLAVRIGSNQKERFDYRLGPDGCVWTFIDEVLVRIRPENARVEILGAVRFKGWNRSGGGGRIAFSGRDIYLSNHRPLRRIRNILSARSNR